jgi:hypothetical protein
MRPAPLGALAALAVLAVGTARAQTPRPDPVADARAAATRGDHAEAYRVLRHAYDPDADDPRLLAELAAAAAAGGEMARFEALLDSVVARDPAPRHALEYHAALALEGGAPAAEVAELFDRHLAGRSDDPAAVLAFTRILLAHGGGAAADELLDRSARRGATPATLALPGGDVRAALADAVGAVAAYAEALVVGDERGEERIRALLAAWPSGSTPRDVGSALERAAARAEPTARITLLSLLAEARAAVGEGEEALAILRELDPRARAGALRLVAEAARARGDRALALAALDDLLALGSPPADAADLALRRAIEREGGTLRAGGSPGAPQARSRDSRLALGDGALARGRADSASAAYAAVAAAGSGAATFEALARLRLVRALAAGGAPEGLLAAVGETLVAAALDPTAAAVRLDSLAARPVLGDTLPARALLRALAAEWRGRAGDPVRASATLERAAETTPAEAAALLLAAGLWAQEAGDLARARSLWRRVVERYGETPYGLEARRLLVEREDAAR